MTPDEAESLYADLLHLDREFRNDDVPDEEDQFLWEEIWERLADGESVWWAMTGEAQKRMGELSAGLRRIGNGG